MAFFEIEQKYRIKDPKAIRVLLKKIGVRKITGGFETNEFFDHSDALRKKKTALRLRRFGKQTTLTLKGPRVPSRFTKRMEIETKVDYRSLRTILLLSGFRAVRGYKKKRELYKLGKAIVTLDLLKKFGWFLEIEGRPRVIANLEKKLGLSPVDREKRSYLQMLFHGKH